MEGIFVAPVSSAPMKSLDEASLIEGRGIGGDRYCERKGTYSVLRFSSANPGEREPGRQLTMISADGVEEALAAKSIAPLASLGDFRRNLVLRGISARSLFGAVGREVALGDEVRVFVHRHCVPCMYNERKNGAAGMMEAAWDASGISCEVIAGGRLRVGDRVEVLSKPKDKARIDAGTQPAGYYTPPSRRSAATVRRAAKQMAEARAALEPLDGEGVARVERAYNSVGLSFWPRRTTAAAAPQRDWIAILIYVAAAVVAAVALLGGEGPPFTASP